MKKLEPKWAALVPLLATALEFGTNKGKRMALAELREMAKAADLWNEHCDYLQRVEDAITANRDEHEA